MSSNTIFHITKLKRKPHIKHHSQADGLWNRLKVHEWGVFCHTVRLRNHPARLKLVLSDSAAVVPLSALFIVGALVHNEYILKG